MEIPSAAEIRAIVQEAVTPLRAEIARLRSRLDEETLSLPEAARKLGTSTRTLQRRIKAGDIPAVKGGRGFRVQLSAILPENGEADRVARKARRG